MIRWAFHSGSTTLSINKRNLVSLPCNSPNTLYCSVIYTCNSVIEKECLPDYSICGMHHRWYAETEGTKVQQAEPIYIIASMSPP